MQRDPSCVGGVPWSWNPEAGVQPGDLHVRTLTEAAKIEGKSQVHEDDRRIHRRQLQR